MITYTTVTKDHLQQRAVAASATPTQKTLSNGHGIQSKGTSHADRLLRVAAYVSFGEKGEWRRIMIENKVKILVGN